MIVPVFIKNSTINITYNQMIEIGFFLGNKIFETCFLSSWLIYGTRKGYIILDLTRNTVFFKLIYSIFGSLIENRQPIWFVCLNLFNFYLMKLHSFLCGEYCNDCFWNSGMISNMKRFLKFAKDRLPYKIYDNKFKYYFINNYLIGSRGRPPGLIFSLNPSFDEIILAEATKNGLPTLSITDTSVDLTGLAFFFIGNNRSFICIWLFLFIFTRLTLIKKFKLFLYWKNFLYNFNRKTNLINFFLLNFLNKENQKSIFLSKIDFVVDSKMVEKFSDYYLERKYFDKQIFFHSRIFDEDYNYIKELNFYTYSQIKYNLQNVDYNIIKDVRKYRKFWLETPLNIGSFSEKDRYVNQIVDKFDKYTYVYE